MRGARKNALRNAVVMSLFALAGTALLAGTYRAAHRTIAQIQEGEELQLLNQVMPASQEQFPPALAALVGALGGLLVGGLAGSSSAAGGQPVLGSRPPRPA